MKELDCCYFGLTSFKREFIIRIPRYLGPLQFLSDYRDDILSLTKMGGFFRDKETLTSLRFL